jgi:hypothetical protein
MTHRYCQMPVRPAVSREQTCDVNRAFEPVACRQCEQLSECAEADSMLAGLLSAGAAIHALQARRPRRLWPNCAAPKLARLAGFFNTTRNAQIFKRDHRLLPQRPWLAYAQS